MVFENGLYCYCRPNLEIPFTSTHKCNNRFGCIDRDVNHIIKSSNEVSTLVKQYLS